MERLLGLCFVIAGLYCCHAAPHKPAFKDHYHASGFIRLPYAELNEPFEIYYEGSKNRSRIDVYNGMDKTYFLGGDGQFGSVYKISPATLKDTPWKETCFNSSGTKANPVVPQGLLPDIHFFSFYMSDLRNGQMVDMWRNVTSVTYGNHTRRNVYTLAVTQTSPPRPVQYEMAGFDSLLGSHFDKYVIDYDRYDEKTAFPNGTFVVPDNKTCQSLFGQGPGSEVVANPFREMVNPEKGARYDQMFVDYRERFGKTYQTNEEHETRKGHFTKNIRMIHSVNRAKRGYTLDINHLADRSFDELRVMRGHVRSHEHDPDALHFDGSEVKLEDLPASINWNIQGAVSPVKDQAICGSCWSFGAAEAMEGAYFMRYNQRVTLSPQMLVDCTWAEGNRGCDGGTAEGAFEWLKKNGGLETETTYGSYLGENGKCHFNKTKGLAKVKSYTTVKSGNQTDLKKALYVHGPVAVAIDASLPYFSFYSYGVFYDKNCGNTTKDLDHAVLAVGYGTLDDQDYFLIKNSWSSYWGNNGFIMISMKDNNCGVATDATYVQVV